MWRESSSSRTLKEGVCVPEERPIGIGRVTLLVDVGELQVRLRASEKCWSLWWRAGRQAVLTGREHTGGCHEVRCVDVWEAVGGSAARHDDCFL